MSTPGTLNLSEVQGDDWTLTLSFTNSLGYAVDLSGATWNAQVRRNYKDDNVAATWTVDTSGAASGVLALSLSHTATAALTKSHYYWDLQQTSGTVTTLLIGEITMIPEVTR